MKRSEAYHVLNELYQYATEIQQEALSIAQDDVQMVDLMQDMTVQRWIPVTERLPDAEYEARPEGTNYYAVIAARMTNVHKNTGWTRERVVDKAWYDGEGFVDIVGIDISVGITHWMPLPTPPKDGES